MSTLLIDAPPSDVSTVKVGTVIGGRYRVLGELGKGGFGAVFAARHTGTGREVAVKVLSSDGDDGDMASLKRFFHEARVTAGLSHPNTIRVFDFGQDDSGVLYLAMEKLNGVTLRQEIRRRAKQKQGFTVAEVVRIGEAVLRSLAEAHAAGLVHRDLKPDNIFLHETAGDDTIVKVLDFGIAKSLGTSLTGASAVLGTPAYMSPEQVQHFALDARSDLYSLGIVLYQLLAGDVPFRGDTPMQVLFMHVQQPVPDIRHKVSEPLPDAVVTVIRRALAKQPDQRYATARQMREALTALTAEMPAISATVPTPENPAARTDRLAPAPPAGTDLSAAAPDLDAEGEGGETRDDLTAVATGQGQAVTIGVSADWLPAAERHGALATPRRWRLPAVWTLSAAAGLFAAWLYVRATGATAAATTAAAPGPVAVPASAVAPPASAVAPGAGPAPELPAPVAADPPAAARTGTATAAAAAVTVPAEVTAPGPPPRRDAALHAAAVAAPPLPAVAQPPPALQPAPQQQLAPQLQPAPRPKPEPRRTPSPPKPLRKI